MSDFIEQILTTEAFVLLLNLSIDHQVDHLDYRSLSPFGAFHA